MLFTERRGMNSGNVKVTEQHHHVASNERHIHVAGTRAISVERLIRAPLVASHRAASKNYLHARWRRPSELADKFVVPAFIAAKYKASHALSDFLLLFRCERFVASEIFRLPGVVCHAGNQSKRSAST